MRVLGARIALSPGNAEKRDFCIHNGRIAFDCAACLHHESLNLDGFLLLPGLINAHDHLEFNLFPKLGNGHYPNAKKWADDIYCPAKSPVREQLRLSKRVRLLWGALKNLTSGVTAVAHHNDVDNAHFDAAFPVKVVRNIGWAHSLDFSPDLADRFRATPPGWPFMVHAAEGVDEHARSEIPRLDRLGVLSDRTILIHAIGVDHPGLELLRLRRSGVVCCPTSNLSVYGSTLSARILRSGVNVALGTDSAITAPTDLIGEIAVARWACNLSQAELYDMVTMRAARLLRLRDGEGELRDNGVADLVAVEDRAQTPAAALEQMTPELVMVRGEVRLFTPRLFELVDGGRQRKWYRLALEGKGCWLTDIDIAALYHETVSALGRDVRLAGRQAST